MKRLTLAAALTIGTITMYAQKGLREIVEDYYKVPSRADTMLASVSIQGFDGYESAYIFNDKMDCLEDITLFRSKVLVAQDLSKVGEMMKKSEEVVLSHIHYADISILMEEGDRRTKKRISRLDNLYAYQKLSLVVIPSITDIVNMIGRYLQALTEEAYVKHSILIIEEEKPPRIIEYGISQKTTERLSSMVREHKKMLDEDYERDDKISINSHKMSREIEALCVEIEEEYIKIFNGFRFNKGSIRKFRKNKVPCIDEFFGLINTSRHHYITDKGYIDLKKNY